MDRHKAKPTTITSTLRGIPIQPNTTSTITSTQEGYYNPIAQPPLHLEEKA